jgi:hypothetical protein
VTALKAAATAAAGSSIVVQDTTTNKAPVPAGASTTNFYLSTDAKFDNPGDTFLGSRAIPALTAKDSSSDSDINSGSATVMIPLATTQGAYFVLAVANGDGAVSESNDENNLRSRKITITP